MSGFELQPGDLYSHGNHVHAVADGVEEAADAGQAVQPGAYGQLCSMVPLMLGALQDVLIGEIAGSARSLRTTAGTLRAVADGYERTDQDIAQGLP